MSGKEYGKRSNDKFARIYEQEAGFANTHRKTKMPNTYSIWLRHEIENNETFK